MVEFLRKITRKMPWLRKILSAVYRNIVYPITSGYSAYMLGYNLKVRKKEIKKLKSKGFSDIKPYLCRSWRIGKGKDHAYRRYYIAEFNGKKAFIKAAKNDATIENEIKAAEYTKPFDFDFVPHTVTYDNSFDENTKMLAMEFSNQLNELSVPDSEETADELCNEFARILDELYAHGIVHADIHPKNLMLDEHGKLILLDFGIAYIKGQSNDVDYVARPGTFYRQSDGIRIYDDAYSFTEMIKKIAPQDSYILKCDAFNRIKDRIGKNDFKVSIKQGDKSNA